jgi:hypothetical protein
MKSKWLSISDAFKVEGHAILGRNSPEPQGINVCQWSRKKKQWVDYPDGDRFEDWQPVQFIEIPK